MASEKEIMELLAQITHPENGKDIVSSGIVKEVSVGEKDAVIVLSFLKKRDPFAKSLKKQVEKKVETLLKESGAPQKVKITELEPTAPAPAAPETTTGGIKYVLAVASGKGGVGKSTVTANLAVALHDMGYRVGILDADVYGPSIPKMFGVEGFLPKAVVRGEQQYIMPAQAGGIKIMSIGFFISPDDALIWRGPMANSALKQLIHQTLWEELDFLLVDLPPGTGDVHLSVTSELKLDGAVIVTTPQQVAVADVRRGIKMFRSAGIDVPVLGLIENMAWFTPEELPANRYYLFGRDGGQKLARTEGVDFLGEIPIIQSVMDGAESGMPASSTAGKAKEYYVDIAKKIVHKLPEKA